MENEKEISKEAIDELLEITMNGIVEETICIRPSILTPFLLELLENTSNAYRDDISDNITKIYKQNNIKDDLFNE